MMIRPHTAMQNDFGAIAAYCNEKGKPVFITEEGEGKYVFMSLDRYHAYNEMLDLRAKLLDAERQYQNGEVYTLEEVEEMMEVWRRDGQ